ncbi:MAG: hypothetical protein ACJ0QL_03365 [Parvicellaceae bacterium]
MKTKITEMNNGYKNSKAEPSLGKFRLNISKTEDHTTVQRVRVSSIFKKILFTF